MTAAQRKENSPAISSITEEIVSHQLRILLLTGIGRLADTGLQAGIMGGYESLSRNQDNQTSFLCSLAINAPVIVDNLEPKELKQLAKIFSSNELNVWDDNSIDLGEELLKITNRKIKKSGTQKNSHSLTL